MSRGRRKPTLRDLSRQWPTLEERSAVIDVFANTKAPSILVAILGASTVEYELERMIRPRFRHRDDETWKILTGNNAPLATLSNKIEIGYAFGLFDNVTKDALNTIRSIRNVFAHSKRLIDFDHELITKEIQGITLPEKKRSLLYKDLKKLKSMKGEAATKAAYIFLCCMIATHLMRLQNRVHHARLGGLTAQSNRRWAKARMSSNPLLGALTGLGLSSAHGSQPRGGGLINNPLSFQADQTGDPIPKGYGIAGPLSHSTLSKKPDSEGS